MPAIVQIALAACTFTPTVDQLGAYAVDGAPAPSTYDDCDADGIYDAWERALLGGDADPADDPDGDGLPHLDEFTAGTWPTLPDTDGDTVNDRLDPYPLDVSR